MFENKTYRNFDLKKKHQSDVEELWVPHCLFCHGSAHWVAKTRSEEFKKQAEVFRNN